LIASCTASAEDVRPPPDKLFFPSGLAVSPPGNSAKVLFVANSNSELRYDSGSITVISLDRVQQIINDWVPTTTTGQGVAAEGCKPDTDHRETLVCDTVTADIIRKDAGVRIGNFATDIAVQNFTRPGAEKLRVFVPTRGDPSVAWADYDGDKLVCSTDEGFAQCDDAHRLASMLNDPDQRPILDEPFSVYATTQPADPLDPSGSLRGFAVVTHLTSGAVTLIDAPEDGTVQLSDAVNGLFAPDTLGLFGTTGIAGHRPGTDEDIIYVGSRSEPRIQTLTVGRPENRTHPYLLPDSFFFLNAVGSNNGVGSSLDTRGLQFSPDGNRMYLVNRRPPTIQIYDTSEGPTGIPRNDLVGATDICRQASSVTVMNVGTAAAPVERAYVTCFQDGEVYVIDPSGQAQVEDIITVGRGPYAIAGAPDQKLVFVSNVLEDTVAVISVDPQSPKRNRVVLRIGVPREQ
jgi:DNA-binding beta-propeller fold protein YncE